MLPSSKQPDDQTVFSPGRAQNAPSPSVTVFVLLCDFNLNMFVWIQTQSRYAEGKRLCFEAPSTTSCAESGGVWESDARAVLHTGASRRRLRNHSIYNARSLYIKCFYISVNNWEKIQHIQLFECRSDLKLYGFVLNTDIISYRAEILHA